MAKLYFYYSAMNAGKSTVLLQSDFNYRERGMETMLWTAALDHRFAPNTITSRIGLSAPAHGFAPETDLFAAISAEQETRPLACVLVDEAQWLAPDQVRQLAAACDRLRIPVLAYGLRTDFRGTLFPGSAALLAIADKLIELKTVCHCGAKATMNLRIDGEGRPQSEGPQIEVGGNERYVAVCRRHFGEALA